jgi:hypothetical protein
LRFRLRHQSDLGIPEQIEIAMRMQSQANYRNMRNSIVIRSGEDWHDNSRKPHLQPMSDLDLTIRNGWGDTKQVNMPENWRTVTRAEWMRGDKK